MTSVRTALPLLALAVLLGTTACGASSGSSTSGQQRSAEQPVPNGQRAGRMPGANGEIVDVSGRTLQVQSAGPGGSQASGQVAVTWNAKTSFTQQVRGAFSDIKVGDCVVVGSAGTASSGAAVTATTVRITGTSGSCGPAAGRAGRGGPGSAPSGAPSGGPGGPSGGPQRRPSGAGFGVYGTVHSITGTGFTVTTPARGSGTPGTTAVSTTGTTTITRTVPATSRAVRVGACVSARGTADDTGAVTASSLAISTKVGGACTGFGGGGFGRPGRGTSASASTRAS